MIGKNRPVQDLDPMRNEATDRQYHTLAGVAAILIGASTAGVLSGYFTGEQREDYDLPTIEQMDPLDEYLGGVERAASLQSAMDDAGAKLVESCGDTNNFSCTFTDAMGNTYDLNDLNTVMPDGRISLTIHSIDDPGVSFGVGIDNDPDKISAEKVWAHSEGVDGSNVDAWISQVEGSVYNVGMQYGDWYETSEHTSSVLEAANLDSKVVGAIQALIATKGSSIEETDSAQRV